MLVALAFLGLLYKVCSLLLFATSVVLQAFPLGDSLVLTELQQVSQEAGASVKCVCEEAVRSQISM